MNIRRWPIRASASEPSGKGFRHFSAAVTFLLMGAVAPEEFRDPH
jgi:hypothetical protein